MQPIEQRSRCHAASAGYLDAGRLSRVQKAFIDRLPMPDRFGALPGTAHFDRANPAFTLVWKAFRYSTNEKRALAAFLREGVIRRLEAPHSLLDIGPDDGSLTAAVSGRFGKITFIEADAASAYKLSNGIFARADEQREYRIIPARFPGVNLGMERYDMVLLSHVIYYFDRRDWVDVVAKAYSHTAYGGALVLVYSGDNGDTAALVRRFGGTALDFSSFENACRDRFHDAVIERHELATLVRASNAEAMMHFSGFLLKDAGRSAGSSELREHVENNLKKDERYYEINKRDTVFVIWKP